MFITQDGELDVMECGERPYIRPPWCRQRFVTIIEGESMTQGVHAEITNVDMIVERFARTGQMPLPTREAQYADVTGLQVDLTEALNQSRETILTANTFADTWQPQEEVIPQMAPVETKPPDPV